MPRHGSLYHRFAGRMALLAEPWLRTVERFQEGYQAALGSESDPRRAARTAARHVVGWSREHPDEAALLLYGATDFGRAEWPEEHTRLADYGNRRVFAPLAPRRGPGCHQRAGPRPRHLALVDLPLSVVRRHLGAGTPLPPHAEGLPEECTEALLR